MAKSDANTIAEIDFFIPRTSLQWSSGYNQVYLPPGTSFAATAQTKNGLTYNLRIHLPASSSSTGLRWRYYGSSNQMWFLQGFRVELIDQLDPFNEWTDVHFDHVEPGAAIRWQSSGFHWIQYNYSRLSGRKPVQYAVDPVPTPDRLSVRGSPQGALHPLIWNLTASSFLSYLNDFRVNSFGLFLQVRLNFTTGVGTPIGTPLQSLTAPGWVIDGWGGLKASEDRSPIARQELPVRQTINGVLQAADLVRGFLDDLAGGAEGAIRDTVPLPVFDVANMTITYAALHAYKNNSPLTGAILKSIGDNIGLLSVAGASLAHSGAGLLGVGSKASALTALALRIITKGDILGTADTLRDAADFDDADVPVDSDIQQAMDDVQSTWDGLSEDQQFDFIFGAGSYTVFDERRRREASHPAD